MCMGNMRMPQRFIHSYLSILVPSGILNLSSRYMEGLPLSDI